MTVNLRPCFTGTPFVSLHRTPNLNRGSGPLQPLPFGVSKTTFNQPNHPLSIFVAVDNPGMLGCPPKTKGGEPMNKSSVKQVLKAAARDWEEKVRRHRVKVRESKIERDPLLRAMQRDIDRIQATKRRNENRLRSKHLQPLLDLEIKIRTRSTSLLQELSFAITNDELKAIRAKIQKFIDEAKAGCQ